MKRILIVVGILATLVGLVWMGQGSGLFPYPASSFMIDQSPWIAYGAVLAVAGLALIFAAWRR
ncbi:hypothetical protein LH464_10275 [Neorhizobium sp. T786]|uniref:hypothetical protein n=1 Tax=Pseudorhizobium xiangyangii TaxID=2883104 RepID=UPI001CFFEF50|nr:hypothetical protein [Neorhizobium xiangyangii]MCB5202855.1 hypothetical protein [Neorhizobium xiangyangii]